MQQCKTLVWMVALAVLTIITALACLTFGAVDIPAKAVWTILTGGNCGNDAWQIIVLQSRLPMVITAILSGAALSVAGLLLQTVFNNPLAGPSILGVSTGAGVGVAVMMLATGGSAMLSSLGFAGYSGVLVSAMIGAGTVILVLIAFSRFVRSATMLLIVGILISNLAASAIALLNFFATTEGVHSYMIWGLGNFNGVPAAQMDSYAMMIIILMAFTMAMVKPLNALLLGERYAENLGIDVRRTRTGLLILSGALTAIVTAFCGPIVFIGMVVPHIARLILGTSHHARLIPATIILGALVALISVLISVTPSSNGVIPINAITPIIGVPIIIYVIINRKNIKYFN